SVINTPTTFYQVNRSRLVLAGSVGILLLGVIVVLSLNILRRRRAERALRKAEEHLRSSQKLEAIGLLAGGVAHDFNNVLQVIRGHAEFLHASVGDSPQLQDVEIIQDAAKRATQLTRQLLAFSRKQPLKRERVDPNLLVSEMVNMLRRLLGEHIDVQVMLLEESCRLIADKGQLEQVLLNLVLNARDAMPSGGRIHIKLHTTRINLTDANDQTDLGDGPFLVLTVSDNGCGMSPKVVARLFEPFFTTKDLGKGTGMGLAVAYGIVRQHGGTIRVYSEAERGSVFKVMLPFTGGIADQPPETPAGGLPRGGGTLLLAEDDAQVRGIGVRILNENGFRVLAAADGEEALQIIDRHHAEISLAILDLIMPKRNGREVFDFMQKHHPTIPVLFCSGYGAEMLPPETAPDAGRALINKPYSPRELLDQIHRLQKTTSN
ncbi:MAG TPA: ATP-binding protein, partial [Opitutus sp.]|nr:ATP-binding protein [Opitutus sp.]